MSELPFSLGRIFAPDANDEKFPMSAVLAPRAETTTRTYRYYNRGLWQGDQGNTSECVGYACTHWLQAGPVFNRNADVHQPIINPTDVYNLAQTMDEWAGEGYLGTSVRAGAKALRQLGYVASFYWGQSVTDIANAILTTGPVVMGTDWYEGMFTPNAAGWIEATGAVTGGHAWLVYGVNTVSRKFLCRNSWGAWGRKGSFWISFDTMEKLMQNHGEAMLAVESSPA